MPHLETVGVPRRSRRRVELNGGRALLDEVDLLLHPLRSELNFPIGKKHPLPLSPRRWVLPMHLLDAVFFGALSRVSMPDFKPTSGTLEMLRDISLVMQREREFAVSSSPHPVLLSESFYHQNLRSLMSQWAFVWLRNQVEVKLGISNTTSASRSGSAQLSSGTRDRLNDVEPRKLLRGASQNGWARPVPLERVFRPPRWRYSSSTTSVAPCVLLNGCQQKRWCHLISQPRPCSFLTWPETGFGHIFRVCFPKCIA